MVDLNRLQGETIGKAFLAQARGASQGVDGLRADYQKFCGQLTPAVREEFNRYLTEADRHLASLVGAGQATTPAGSPPVAAVAAFAKKVLVAATKERGSHSKQDILLDALTTMTQMTRTSGSSDVRATRAHGVVRGIYENVADEIFPPDKPRGALKRMARNIKDAVRPWRGPKNIHANSFLYQGVSDAHVVATHLQRGDLSLEQASLLSVMDIIKSVPTNSKMDGIISPSSYFQAIRDIHTITSSCDASTADGALVTAVHGIATRALDKFPSQANWITYENITKLTFSQIINAIEN